MTTLALTNQHWDELLTALSLDIESAAVVWARRSEGEELTLLARSVKWVPDELYLRRERTALEIVSLGYFPALKHAADDGAVALFFHTHPGGLPTPSEYDEAVDTQLAEPFRLRTRQDMYGSFILGGTPQRPMWQGSVGTSETELRIDRLRIVGDRIRLFTTATADAGEAIFDRQIRAFGTEGQALLSQLRVGVVGLGATGSTVFEHLVRLGVGSLIICDDDLVSESNLTRIHEVGRVDIGTLKVNVAEAMAARVGLGTRVRALPKRITHLEAASALRDCDVIFGCTDDNRGRAILSRLAYWYLVPVIDTAFLVDTEAGRVRGLFGRVTPVHPGVPCLFCRGRIDPGQLMGESLPPEERERLAAEGYVPGLGEPDPSVGAYTTLAASFAVAELLDRLFGFSDAKSTELLIRVHDRAISRIAAQSKEGHYCVDTGTWGRGDTEPFLEQLWAD